MQKSMKLLERIVNEVHENPLLKQDIVVLHMNHCMDNSFDFSEVMCRVFHKVVFIGVPYNDKVIPEGYSFCGYYGIYQDGSYRLFREGQDFGSSAYDFFEAVEKLIEKAMEEDILPLLKRGKRLLILEDGGYHYGLMQRMTKRYPILKECVVGSVEQTTSGTVRGCKIAEKMGYLYPHTSVARSNIKMNIESRFIAHRVVEELSTFLYTANAFLDFHNILLLGYGVVGRRIAQDLRGRKLQLTVYDQSTQILRAARMEGMNTTECIDRNCFTRNTVLIGNTGCTSFSREMLEEFLEGEGDKLYLASSSSQDEEFCFLYHGREKRVYLVAKGLPVNFYRRDVISLTNSMIDLIFAQMLSIGIELCLRRDVKKRLYLYGEDTEWMQSFSEEELLRLWFSEYGYAEEKDMQALMDEHPETKLLRRMMRENIR
ncbi:MAG: hypothetical protein Q4F24_02870 [Eubacteriales bacterium]|nr:hypothetical protein [Eubacteriales bacterium]